MGGLISSRTRCLTSFEIQPGPLYWQILADSTFLYLTTHGLLRPLDFEGPPKVSFVQRQSTYNEKSGVQKRGVDNKRKKKMMAKWEAWYCRKDVFAVYMFQFKKVAKCYGKWSSPKISQITNFGSFGSDFWDFRMF